MQASGKMNKFKSVCKTELITVESLCHVSWPWRKLYGWLRWDLN